MQLRLLVQFTAFFKYRAALRFIFCRGRERKLKKIASDVASHPASHLKSLPQITPAISTSSTWKVDLADVGLPTFVNGRRSIAQLISGALKADPSVRLRDGAMDQVLYDEAWQNGLRLAKYFAEDYHFAGGDRSGNISTQLCWWCSTPQLLAHARLRLRFLSLFRKRSAETAYALNGDSG